MKKNSKVGAVAGLTVCIIIVSAFVIYNLYVAPLNQPPSYQRQILNRFPISLDVLFKTDQPAQRNSTLNAIKTGQTEMSTLFIVPYPNYFHSYHSPAAFKWYLYVGRHTPISFPVDTYMLILQDRGNTTKVINGSLIKIDLHVAFLVNYYVAITLDHACINQSLYDAWQSAPSTSLFGYPGKFLSITKDKIVGFTHNSTALDFMISDRTVSNYGTTLDYNGFLHVSNPFLYFTPAIQNQLMTYYNDQYEAMKQSGMYVESTLNRTYNINEPSSLFGTWFYKSGFFAINDSHHQYGWYAFDGCILNILNVNKTDRQTFYKDKNTALNFTSDMIGVYYDARYIGVTGYSPIGGKYVYFIEGNYSQGIVRLDNFLSNVRPSPIFMRYQLIPNGPSMFDDTLRVDYFGTLGAAQSGFTAYNLTYIRLYEYM